MARVLFLQDNGINESLALTELSAVLKTSGHDTRLLLYDEEKERWSGAIRAWQPDLVVLPCNVFGHRFVLNQVEHLAQDYPDLPVLPGGTHPTFSSDILMASHVKMILVGEADKAVPELVRRIESGDSWTDIPGIWTRSGDAVVRTGPGLRLKNLDDAPPPDRELYYRYPFMARFPWKKFTTGRGCHNRCSFCYNSFVQDLYGDGGFVRRKSPMRVLEEVDRVGRVSTLKWAHFSDDLFVTELDWLEEFSGRWSREQVLPFSCNSSADRMTPAVARLLADAGCQSVAIGVETAHEKTRMQMLAKPTTNAVIQHAAQCIKGAGMKLVTFNMVGLPGETLEDARKTLAYSRKLGADAIRITMALPLPGTRMAKEGGVGFEEAVDIREDPHGPYFPTGDDARIEHALNLSPLLWNGRAGRITSQILRHLPPQATRPLRLWMSFQEMNLFRFTLWDGFQFYLHTGDPHNRTTNYVALI